MQEDKKIIQKGDIQALRAMPLRDFFVGIPKPLNTDAPASIKQPPPELKNIRSVIVHLGYNPEELRSPEFIKYMRKAQENAYAIFPQPYYRFDFLLPKQPLPLTLYETKNDGPRNLQTDSREMSVLKDKLRTVCGWVDLLEIHVNPRMMGVSRLNNFGCAISYTVGTSHYVENIIARGPKTNRLWNGLKTYRSSYFDFLTQNHERLHGFSYGPLVTGYKEYPAFFADSYKAAFSRESVLQNIREDRHSEWFLERHLRDDKIECWLMRRVIWNSKHPWKWYDTGLSLDGQRIITPSPGKTIMNCGVNKLSPFQQALLAEITYDFLKKKRHWPNKTHSPVAYPSQLIDHFRPMHLNLKDRFTGCAGEVRSLEQAVVQTQRFLHGDDFLPEI